MNTTQYPLEGMTVLDLGQVYQGPYCGFLLALAGARVIKIEPPGGDSVRNRSDAPNGVSLSFAMLNSNKEGMTLDLKSEAGRETLLELAEHADIVLENFAPGVMEKLGLGPEQLHLRNPRLIYASGSGYGSTGPYRDVLAMDLTIQAIGGIMSVTGFPDGPPVKAGAAVSDFLGGSHLYGAVLTALMSRERTGKGCVVETAMFDMCYHPLASNLSMLHKQKKQIPRTGNRHGGLSVVPYNVYPASDGYVAIICVKDHHWRTLTCAMGQPELGTDPRYANNQSRADVIDEVDALVSAWTQQLPKEEIFAISQRERFPAAPVRDLLELSRDPHLHQRGALQDVDHPVLGMVALPHSPIRFRDVPRLPLTPSPGLGQDNAAVLADLLKLSAEQIDSLAVQGAFGLSKARSELDHSAVKNYQEQ